MADDQGHVLLGDWAHGALRYDVSLAGVTTYPDYCDTLVAAVARGARRFQPSTCVAAEGGRKLYMRFFGQDIACYDGKQWRGIRFNDRVDAMHESPKYGVLIQTGPNEHSAMDNGQLRRIDTPGGPMLWSENGLQPYEAALLERIRTSTCRSSRAAPAESPGCSACPRNRPPATPPNRRPRRGFLARRGRVEQLRIRQGVAFARIRRGVLGRRQSRRALPHLRRAGHRVPARPGTAGRARRGHSPGHRRPCHNLWFFLGFGRFGGVPRLLCKRVDGFALRGPEAAVEVADHGGTGR